MGEFSRRLPMRQRTSGFPPAQRHAARRRERWRDRRPADRGVRSPSSAADAVWRSPARTNGTGKSMPSGSCAPGRGPGAQRSGARSDRRVARRPDRTPVHDGRMAVDEAKRSGPPVVRQTTPGKLPPFIGSPPKGCRGCPEGSRRAGALVKRYLSNITIVERHSELAALPAVCCTRLDRYAANGIFRTMPAWSRRHRAGLRESGGLTRAPIRPASASDQGADVSTLIYAVACHRRAPSPYPETCRPEWVRGASIAMDGPRPEPRRRSRAAAASSRCPTMPPALLVERLSPGEREDRADRAGGLLSVRPNRRIRWHHRAGRRSTSLDRAGRGCPDHDQAALFAG